MPDNAHEDTFDVMLVFGSPSEAVKMAPVVLELQKRNGLRANTVSTSPGCEMLGQVLDHFNIVPDYEIDVIHSLQTMTQIIGQTAAGLRNLFDRCRPDLVLVQGDTATALSAALTAFHHKIRVGHLEAGLRTYNKHAPFSEEVYRRMISAIAHYHFCPTEGNRENLLSERVDPQTIRVTGNTVIDALRYTLRNGYETHWMDREPCTGHKLVLVTASRRENFGEPLRNICRALIDLTEEFDDLLFIYPVHSNPQVRDTVYSMLSGRDRIVLTDPLGYGELCRLMNRSHLVLTDSGILQEQAPSLGKPVILLRSETERPEAVAAGAVKVVGTETRDIVEQTAGLLRDSAAYSSIARAIDAYGDGAAAVRIVDFLQQTLCGPAEAAGEEDVEPPCLYHSVVPGLKQLPPLP